MSLDKENPGKFQLNRLAILGCGVMGKAIVTGLIENGVIAKENVTASVSSASSAAKLHSELGINAIAGDNATVVKSADVILLCIKPFYAQTVLTDPSLAELLHGKLIISILAGCTLAQFTSTLAPRSRVVRAMTNTPSKIRQGMTAVCGGPLASQDDVRLTLNIFKNVGRCLELEEKHFDAVTALAGSGPAFALMFVEALADGGVMMGLPRKVAIEMAAQMVQGSANLVLQTGEHPAVLKDNVTTPGGCTIAGLLALEDGKLRGTVSRAVETATRRAGELGQTKK